MDNISLYNLLVDYQNGNKKSFHVFYEELKKPVFYNILSITKSYEISEDLLQETFVKLLENIKKLNKKNSILGYLMVISKNLSLDYLKKNKNITINEEEFENEEKNFLLKKNNADKEDINFNEMLFLIKNILKPKEFEIFTLHLIDDLSYKEISELLKIPIGTLTYTYVEIIKKLKNELEGRNNYE